MPLPSLRLPAPSRLAALAGCVLLLGAAAQPADSTPVGLRLVSLGDSVPAGDVCGCTAFPDLVARGLSARGTTAVVDQLAEGGATAEDVETTVANSGAALARADVVVLEAGANDLEPLIDADPPTTAVDQEAALDAAMSTLDTTIDEVRAATDAQVVVVDYWAVGLDGDAAQQQYTAAQRADQAELTDAFDDRLAALAEGRAVFVDLRPVFHGADGTADPSALLADDGDHPSAAGHEAIAAAVVDAVQATGWTSGNGAGSPRIS